MSKTRQDAWSQADDKVLADIVLNHIRTGGTQLAAFEEADKHLNRTAAACGFRWNAVVRKRSEKDIKEAKLARKSLKAGSPRKSVSVTDNKSLQTEIFVTVSQLAEPVTDQKAYTSDYLDEIITLAQNQKHQLVNMARQIKALNEKLNQKDRTIQQLMLELDEVKAQPSELTVTEDYKTLLQILQRARQIGAIDEVDKEKPVFKMDANGNIEMIG